MSEEASRSNRRRGPFWDAVEGRAPMPPVANLLGWQLEEIDPGAGTITVRFQAREEFVKVGSTNAFVEADLVDGSNKLIARASATVRIITTAFAPQVRRQA